MSRSIAFINQKGGVGKTTLVANAGAWWARQGRRVLLIDLDPQSHLSLHFGLGGEADREGTNIYRVLRGDCTFTEAVIPIPEEGVDLVPAHIDLSAAEWELGQEVGREVIFRDLLCEFLETRSYDLVLIDCPPSLGLLSLNALAAVDDVVVPVQAEFFALQGMAQLMRVVELVRSRLHPDLCWRAVVPTLVDTRTNLGKEVISELESHVPGKVTEHWLTKRVKVAEAPSFGQSIFTYAPGSPAASEFRALCEELEERLELPPVLSHPSAPPITEISARENGAAEEIATKKVAAEERAAKERAAEEKAAEERAAKERAVEEKAAEDKIAPIIEKFSRIPPYAHVSPTKRIWPRPPQ